MLTKADEYPIHQTPDPIAYSGTDPNFYDRFFFNGYERNGSGDFFAVAFGVYPHIGVMDGALSVIRDGVQRSVFASRTFEGERMDTHAGPISVEIVEPLKQLRVRVGPNKYGLEADLLFTSLTPLVEEPRFIFRDGTRTIQDVTRMTQLGAWSGWISVDGVRQEVNAQDWRGVRDRSWGVRPLGSASAWTAAEEDKPTPAADKGFSQFYWLWAPLIFEDSAVLYLVNEDAGGVAWHSNVVVAPVGGQETPIEKVRFADARVGFGHHSRWATSAELRLVPWRGPERVITLEPLYRFHMMGVGYAHPEWQHGRNKGPLVVGGETIDLASIDPSVAVYQHVQSFCRARMVVDGEPDRYGAGVLEQLILGPHEPTGFQGLLEMLPEGART